MERGHSTEDRSYPSDPKADNSVPRLKIVSHPPFDPGGIPDNSQAVAPATPGKKRHPTPTPTPTPEGVAEARHQDIELGHPIFMPR